MTRPTNRRTVRQCGNAAVGLLTFLAGIVLIGFAFKLAYDIFTVPPQVAVAGTGDQPMELNATVNNLGKVLIQTLLLVVMAFIGSLVANQGIKLYAKPSSRPVQETKPTKTNPEPAKHPANDE